MGDPSPRDLALDRIADLGEFDRWAKLYDGQEPHWPYKVALDEYVAHQPSSSLRHVSTTAAALVRRLTIAAGRLEPRALRRLCFDLRFDFIAEPEQRLREDVAAWQAPLGVPAFLFGDEAEPADDAGVGGGERLRGADDDPEHPLEDDLRVGLADRAAPRPSILAHAVVPVLLGAAIGAGAAVMLRASKARRETSTQPVEAA